MQYDQARTDRWALIEVRTYRTHSGKREELLRLLVERALPLQRDLGMRVLGPFPSLEDQTTFVWLQAFPARGRHEHPRSS
jgi:hypothetical protein